MSDWLKAAEKLSNRISRKISSFSYDKIADRLRGEKDPEEMSELEYIRKWEGFAGKLNKESEYTGIKGEPDTRVKGSSAYGLYYDSAGKLTSGIGRLHSKNLSKEEIEKYKNTTEAEAVEHLKIDREREKDKIRKHIAIPLEDLLTPQQEKAVTSYVFNVGVKPNWEFTKSMANASIMEKNSIRDRFLEKVTENMDINTSDGVYKPGLERRRKEERALMRTAPKSTEDPKPVKMFEEDNENLIIKSIRNRIKNES